MSYKDRSVAADNWEPGKGCNCSSELKPDLMVAETVMGQSRFPEWSWGTSGPGLKPLFSVLCLSGKLALACWLAPPL